MGKNLAVAYAMLKKQKQMLADGGSVTPKPSPSPSQADSIGNQDKRKQIADSFKSVFAKGGYVPEHKGGMEKGIHKSGMYENHPLDKGEKSEAGESMAGFHTKNAAAVDGDKPGSAQPYKYEVKQAVGEHKKILGEMKAMKKPNLKGMAEGGLVKLSGADRSPVDKNKHSRGVHNPWMSQGESHAGIGNKLGLKAESKASHSEKLAELKSMPNPNLKGLAEGGYIEDEMASGYHSLPEDDVKMNDMAMGETNKKLGQHHVDMQASTSMKENDLVDRVMEKLSKDFSSDARYSEGGMVANDTGDGLVAGRMPNQFDDLVLRDNLEFSDDFKNSGDDLGNKQQDEDRKDIVARIMASNKKKDKLPSPR